MGKNLFYHKFGRMEKKMSLYEKIVAGEEKISLVGLGYVGMPIAVAFARKVKVVY